MKYVVGDFGDHDACGCLSLWWSVLMCKVLRDRQGLDAMAGSLVNALGCLGCGTEVFRVIFDVFPEKGERSAVLMTVI